jgi:hypothetical protein
LTPGSRWARAGDGRSDDEVSPSTNASIRSRAPLLNSTGVFDLRNSDCERRSMAPMSLTACASGLNRPARSLLPCSSATRSAVLRFATRVCVPRQRQGPPRRRPHAGPERVTHPERCRPARALGAKMARKRGRSARSRAAVGMRARSRAAPCARRLQVSCPHVGSHETRGPHAAPLGHEPSARAAGAGRKR